MALFELTMPKMGESIIEATILRWTKSIGDAIAAEEAVLEIATDKVDSDVPSPVQGVLAEMRFKEGDVVPVGAVIALIETAAAGQSASPARTETPALTAEVPFVPAEDADSEGNGEDRFYSPLVMNIARTEGIGTEELGRIAGSGRGGRVTKKDILVYLEARTKAPAPVAAPVAPAKPAEIPVVKAPVSVPAFTAPGAGVEIIEMDRMRKIIAQNMLLSKQTSAHVTSFVEADVTNLVLWRNKVKDAFQARYGVKLTLTPVFVIAAARALREFPNLNASVEGDKIILKKDVHIGVAVALPNDNLIVPVIRHADRLNLAGLAGAVNDLADRARRNKLKADELEGGTYTVSNVGTFGSIMGTPIILQPQVGIMATGAIRKIAAVIETSTGDMIGIRQRMFLSHTYDHRIIDGSLGSRFAKRMADILEAWDIDTEI
ncbi:MAG: 2-oxo acid dehydrogenase subunit E2 [Bacteroidetes bacterium]|nr:MAG: 2-oxo acid dehydrogenase subunit E2 [Bacteroidota bacterium]